MKKIIAALAVCTLATSAFAARLDESSPNFRTKTTLPQQELVVGSGNAEVVVPVDITGVLSVDEEGAPTNTVLSVPLPGGVVDGVGWDLTQTAGIDAGGASWLNEMTIAFDWEQDGVNDLFLTPSATGSPGTESNSSGGILDLTDNGIPDGVVPTGSINIEFFESFIDDPGFPEGIYDQGVLSISVVPEPSAFVLFGLAALSLLGIRRR